MIRTFKTAALSVLTCVALAGVAHAGNDASTKGIVDTAAANGSFGTLVAAVKAGGPVDNGADERAKRQDVVISPEAVR